MLVRTIGSVAPRCRSFVELMSGCAELSRQLRLRGLQGTEFDAYTHHSSENVTTLTGLVWATLLVMSVWEPGIVTAAPRCSTWVSASVYTMGRNQHGVSILGYEEEREDVASANQTAERLGFLLLLAHLRGLFIWVEQPQSSTLSQHPAVQFTFEVTNVHKVYTWQGGTTLGGVWLGHPMPKPSYMYTTLPVHVHDLMRGRRPPPSDQPSSFHGLSGNGRWWHGNQQLASSEAYPPQFAAAVAQAFAVAAEPWQRFLA